jgi:hypothetical protein
MNETTSVNLTRNIAHEVNIRLSKQMRDILLFLYDGRLKVHQQVMIIENIYGDFTYSRAASVSRSIKVLIKAKLVESRKAYYSNQFGCWISQRVHFFITEAGEHLVEKNLLEQTSDLAVPILKQNALMVKT